MTIVLREMSSACIKVYIMTWAVVLIGFYSIVVLAAGNKRFRKNQTRGDI